MLGVITPVAFHTSEPHRSLFISLWPPALAHRRYPKAEVAGAGVSFRRYVIGVDPDWARATHLLVNPEAEHISLSRLTYHHLLHPEDPQIRDYFTLCIAITSDSNIIPPQLAFSLFATFFVRTACNR